MIISSESRCVDVLLAACPEMKIGKREKVVAVCSAARTRATTASYKCYSSSAVSQRERPTWALLNCLMENHFETKEGLQI